MAGDVNLEQLHAMTLGSVTFGPASILAPLQSVPLGGEGALWMASEPARRIAALEAEAQELRKDAERYRWLRARVSGHRALGSARPATFAFPGTMALPPLGDIMRGSVAEHLDCAIDAQMLESAAVGAA